MSKRRSFDAADLLASAAGAIVGVAIGFIAGGSMGRINRTRLKSAMGRLSLSREVPRRWTEDAAERLEAKVLDALAQDVVLARRPIRVSVLGMGLVELTGTVLHTAEIGVASDVVQQVSGVETVLNHLVVDAPTRPPRAARG